MEGELLGAVIAAAVALFGIGVTAAVAVFQITKQARMGLKVELYREALSAIDSQGDTERELSTKLRVLKSLISVWQKPEQFGGIRPNSTTSWSEFHDLSYKAQGEAAELMILIEKWQIVEPKLDLFRLAFGSASHDLRQAWMRLEQPLGAIVATVPGGPIPQQPPKEALDVATEAIDSVLNAASTLSSWVADFQLEMQSLLLSDLFKNDLKHREPLDPQFFVVRLDRYDSQKDHFLNRTAWGREMQAVNARTKAEIAQQGLG
jgi:hypothetical protein